MYTTRTTCRVCGSSQLEALFSLGWQYVSDFISPDDSFDHAACPIDIVYCETCSLVQQKHTAPQELLYSGHYWYKSGTSELMRKSLAELAYSLEELMQLSPYDVVLDIGSNDGTFLRSYKTPNLIKVGVEPASNLKEIGSKGVEIFIDEFWSAESYYEALPRIHPKLKLKPKVITALGMFYDLEDPNQFIADVALVLDPQGIFVTQLMCLENMIEMNDVGNFCHEHLEFYSFKSLEYLMNSHGLEIFDVEVNKVNGQSYRLYMKHKGADICLPFDGAKDRIQNCRDIEKELDVKSLKAWFRRLEFNKNYLKQFINQRVAEGCKIWIRGASTKGNTILQWIGLDNDLIELAEDKDPSKWGRLTIGTNIPIHNPKERTNQHLPDYILILPYAFANEIMKEEENSEWRKRGGKFIIPFPEMRIV